MSLARLIAGSERVPQVACESSVAVGGGTPLSERAGYGFAFDVAGGPVADSLRESNASGHRGATVGPRLKTATCASKPIGEPGT